MKGSKEMPAKKKVPAKGHSPQPEKRKKSAKNRHVSANTVRKQGKESQPTRITSVKKAAAAYKNIKK